MLLILAAAALFIARKGHAAAKLSSVVNKARNFTIRPVPEGLFRITLKQKAERKASAIKPKLSGFS